jgi:hypothetical protein
MAVGITLNAYEINGIRLASGSKTYILGTGSLIVTGYPATVNTNVGGTQVAFAASTGYTVGQVVYSGNGLYQVIVPGTSGLIGTAPSVDAGYSVSGTVTFNYIGQYIANVNQNASPNTVLNSYVRLIDGTVLGVAETPAAVLALMVA